ncbi:MAG: cytochrome c biogenesis protein ResB, partial [Bacteroidales bacterium]|nr:cytochrome c biogenesis protein ResB [Bacteroidales bacterium]
MKLISRILFARTTMGVLMAIFAISMMIATFIENDFGIPSVRNFFYDALWFKLMLLFLAVNILGIVIKDRLLQRKRYTLFMFHVSFVLILLGGAITDLTGYEGLISIREGSSSNKFLSADTYVSVQVKTTEEDIKKDYKVRFSLLGRNRFNHNIALPNDDLNIKLTGFKVHSQGDNQFDLVEMELNIDTMQRSVVLIGAQSMKRRPDTVNMGGHTILLAYGSIYYQLPFDLHLDDFIMERYSGTDNPMSYKSLVKVIDKRKGIEYPYDIYMNHILNYGGYRFFQSSYDKDEKGTILSVNHDAWGTWVTYLGYLVMGLGMILSLFYKNTRFSALARNAGKATAVIVLLLGTSLQAQDTVSIPEKHVEKLSELLIQDQKGRIKPFYTFSSEVLRKVARKTSYNNMNPVEVLLSWYMEPEKWYDEPMVRVGHPKISEMLGREDKYVSYRDLFSDAGFTGYKLSKHVNEAFRKSPGERSKFDNEIIRLNERVSVFYSTLNSSNLNIYPSSVDSLGRWYNPLNNGGSFTGKDSAYAEHAFYLYISELKNSVKSGDWTKPDNVLESFFIFQQKNTDYDLPSNKKIQLEISYYKFDVFNRLSGYYMLVGFLLLIFQFLFIFNPKIPQKVPFIIGLVFISLLFLMHAGGLVSRWIISGHAPWSNGYEALVYISWGCIVVGLIFSRIARVILSLAAILAGLILMTAHLNFMDPQVTNLVPVLDSIWLIIHVAIITISYAFLGVGALVAALNLLVMFLQTPANRISTGNSIDKLSKINELILTVGLYLLAIGTFLGGVWA